MYRGNEADKGFLGEGSARASPENVSCDKSRLAGCDPTGQASKARVPLNEIKRLTIREALDYLHELPDGTMLEVILDDE